MKEDRMEGESIVVRGPRVVPPPHREVSVFEEVVRMEMREASVSGDPRDYVVLTEDGVVSAFGRYEIAGHLRPDVEAPKTPFVVSRRRLYRYVRRDVVKTFWRSGRRTRR